MSILTFFDRVNNPRKLIFTICSLVVLFFGLFVFNIAFWAHGSTLDETLVVGLAVRSEGTATAELTKVLVTPADEPTPDLTFTFLIERVSLNGDPVLYN